MTISTTNYTLNNALQLLSHHIIINNNRNLLTLLIKLQSLVLQIQVLLLSPQIIINNHLHIQPIISLLGEAHLLLLIRTQFNLFFYLFLYPLDMLFSLVYDFDGFSVFFHLGVDGSFV